MKLKLQKTIYKMSRYFLFGFAIQMLVFNLVLAVDVNGQYKSIDEVQVKIEQGSMTLNQFFSLIEKQTPFQFTYDSRAINKKARIVLEKNEGTVENFLLEVSLQASLSFRQVNNNIDTKKKADKEPISLETEVEVTVSGKVTDDSGEPLPGASVTVAGTTTGTVTDIDGDYTITVPDEATLIFSYIGFESMRVPVDNRTQINVTLKTDMSSLEEVVVIGYGEQKKVNLTGAVSTVDMESTLGDRPITDLGSALQGAAPGLGISGSAIPGESKSFNIRGFTSINGGSPLILLDNVPIDVSLINPEDIESVSILKDASAAAIYGARGAFGVILLTSKKAKKNSRLQLNYSLSTAVSTSINSPREAPIEDVLRAHIESDDDGLYYAEGQNLERWLGLVQDYNNGTFQPNEGEYFVNGIYRPDDENIYYYLKDNKTNSAIVDNGFQQIHNISADGGSDKLTYRMSLGYTDQDGILITNKDRFSRINVGSYINADLTPWLSQSIDFQYLNGKRTYVEADGEIYRRSLTFPGFYPAGTMPLSSDIDGPEYPLNTPANFMHLKDPVRYNDANTRIFSRTSIHPFEGLEGILEYSFNKINSDTKDFNSPFLMTNDQMAVLWSENPSSGRYRNDKSVTNYTLINAYATYQKSFGQKHNVKAMVGYSQEESYFERMWVQRDDLIDLARPSLSGATGIIQTNDVYREFSIRSGYFRLNYDYEGKYLVEINGRYDGSSKFPEENRFGLFPSFSLGWRLDQEKFMDWSDSWLDNLKFRASWGQLGNQAIDEYGFTPIMNTRLADWISNGRQPITLGTPALVRNNFTWEVVESSNVAVDFSLLKGRLDGTFEWYRRDTKGMLIPGAEFPSVVGTGAPQQNAADLRTKGWELSLSWRDQIGEVGYNFGFNVFDSHSKITKYDNEAGLFYDLNSRQSANRYRVGMTLGEIWGYTTDRFYTIDDFQEGWQNGSWVLKEGVATILGNNNVRPGDILFKNIRDDEENGSVNQIDGGRNNVDDPGDRTIIGNETPRYQFGINGRANWRNFNLSFILQGVMQRDAWLDGRLRFPFGGGGAFGTIYEGQTNYWRPVDAANGDYTAVDGNAFFPRLYDPNQSASSNTRIQTKYLADASYLRIKNITLAYVLPLERMNNPLFSAARVFFSGENIGTFTKLPSGYDPERLNWGYPFFATYSLGINVTL